MEASINVFATYRDLDRLVEFLFEKTDMRAFEPIRVAKRPIQPVEYASITEYLANPPAGVATFVSPSVSRGPVYERSLATDGRVVVKVNDPAAIRVVPHARRDKDRKQPIRSTQIAYWSEAGARQSFWPDSVLDDVDWLALRRLGRRIEYFLRNKLAVARFFSDPILPDAYDYLKSGGFLVYAGLIGVDDPRIEKL